MADVKFKARQQERSRKTVQLHPVTLEFPSKDISPHPEPHKRNAQWFVWMRANDPSAGSPTETLLRLLLPLSDKVH